VTEDLSFHTRRTFFCFPVRIAYCSRHATTGPLSAVERMLEAVVRHPDLCWTGSDRTNDFQYGLWFMRSSTGAERPRLPGPGSERKVESIEDELTPAVFDVACKLPLVERRSLHSGECAIPVQSRQDGLRPAGTQRDGVRSSQAPARASGCAPCNGEAGSSAPLRRPVSRKNASSISASWNTVRSGTSPNVACRAAASGG